MSCVYLKNDSMRKVSFFRCVDGIHWFAILVSPSICVRMILKFVIQQEGVHLRKLVGVLLFRTGCWIPAMSCTYSNSLKSSFPVSSLFRTWPINSLIWFIAMILKIFFPPHPPKCGGP